jgi:hypothetical protein
MTNKLITDTTQLLSSTQDQVYALGATGAIQTGNLPEAIRNATTAVKALGYSAPASGPQWRGEAAPVNSKNPSFSSR